MIDLESLIREAAEPLQMRVESHCDGWLLVVEQEGRRAHIVGHVFPFNTAADAALFDDKCALSVILGDCGIPHVPHHLISAYCRDEAGLWKLMNLDMPTIEDLLTQLSVTYPIVVKPVRGTNGTMVRRVADREACVEVLADLLDRFGMAAAAPYLDIEAEHRIVILRGNPLCILEKVRRDDWRHNLSHGATATVVREAPGSAELAVKAADVLGAELATVDCVRVDGRWLVLEINSGTKLVAFAKQSADDGRFAVNVYRRILLAMFAN